MIPAAQRLISDASRIVTFSGAGLSAESGVPTFRDAQTGVWAEHDPMTLASPQGFDADPALVIDWYASRRRALARPHLRLRGHRRACLCVHGVSGCQHQSGQIAPLEVRKAWHGGC